MINPITRKGLPLLAIIVLLSTTVTLTEFTNSVSANFMFPEQPPAGIHITANGMVQGTDKIKVNGNTYTLTGDLSETISILRDNIILDGAGHSLIGNDASTGVFLQERAGVTIRNLNIENCQYGIKMTWIGYSDDKTGGSITIADNTLKSNMYGVAVMDGSTVTLTDNSFIENAYGAYQLSGSIFRDNKFKDNDYCIYDYYGVNDIDSSNTINGKPMIFWVNQHDKAIPTDAGWVLLNECSNITVASLNLERCSDGLTLYCTNNSKIKDNSIYGIRLVQSHYNTISKNKISHSIKDGIYVSYSTNTVMSNNEIFGNGRDGVAIEFGSYNNTINQNKITGNNEAGVAIRAPLNNVRWNIFNANLSLPPFQSSTSTDHTLITQNVISKNDMGILFDSASRITVTLNNITGNYGWGMRLNGSQTSNSIHHNSFIDNNAVDNASELQVCIAGFFNQTITPRPAHSNVTYLPPNIQFVAGDTNFWDDGLEGNYWSDYIIRFPNTTQTGHTGDTPFYINENNQDNHPLMTPVDIYSTGSATANIENPSEEVELNTYFIAVGVFVIACVIASLGLLGYFRRNKVK